MAKLTLAIKELTVTVKQQQATITVSVAKVWGSNEKTDKTNSQPEKPGNNRARLHMCKNCHQIVKHKDENCLELDENTHKHVAGWTSWLWRKKGSLKILETDNQNRNNCYNILTVTDCYDYPIFETPLPTPVDDVETTQSTKNKHVTFALNMIFQTKWLPKQRQKHITEMNIKHMTTFNKKQSNTKQKWIQ